MATYESPRSHAERLIFLSRSAITGQQDIDAGRNYVTQATIDQVNATLTPYRAAVNAIAVASAGRSHEVHARDEVIAPVITYTRDLWEVLKRRVHRLGQPASVLAFYGLTLEGIVPRPTTTDQWLEAASSCVEGDAAAVTAGYPAMANPSAAELAAVMATAVPEVSDAVAADRALDEALALAASFIPAADEVIDDVMQELRFNTRKMDFPGQRRIQRSYGAHFRTAPGEPSDGAHTQELGRGDGIITMFNGVLEFAPIEPGSINATDGIEIFTDTPNTDGSGTLSGSNGGTGTVQYANGVISINFMMAPTLDQPITVNYVEQLDA
ncbi:MAG: hypothetical protein GC178_12720 [Flavobacteriales bacterium]|nr:hypothetical protein [Flavobacteriales bacterium]